MSETPETDRVLRRHVNHRSAACVFEMEVLARNLEKKMIAAMEALRDIDNAYTNTTTGALANAMKRARTVLGRKP